MYTKAQFGHDLEEELKEKYEITHLSRWAFNKYTCNNELEKGLSEQIMKIVAMDEGAEFEYTKDELQKLAKEMQGK